MTQNKQSLVTTTVPQTSSPTRYSEIKNQGYRNMLAYLPQPLHRDW